MQPPKQPDQNKVSHPHNSERQSATLSTKAQIRDKNHLINTNMSKFQTGKINPSKKTFKKYNGTFQAFLLSQSAKSK